MENKKQNQKVRYKIIIIFFIIIIIFSGYVFYLYTLRKDDETAKKFISDSSSNLINNNLRFTDTTNDANDFNSDSSQGNGVSYETERIDKVRELQKQNSDIVGWLEIPNTNISYPVLQGIDNSYYMTHNYKKKKSKNGSLFLDKDYNWNKPSTNLLIYGHNNRGTNEMFVELLNYKEESFYKEHTTIRFTTEKEDAIYDIISVFLSRVYYKREKDVFRYYYFIDANNEEEFDYYINESKKASLYNIEETAEYGSQLITLSTCEYSQEDGRFVVVGRKQK